MHTKKEQLAWVISAIAEAKGKLAELKENRKFVRQEMPVVWFFTINSHMRETMAYDAYIRALESAKFNMCAYFQFKYRFGEDIAVQYYPFPKEIKTEVLFDAGVIWHRYKITTYPLTYLMRDAK